MDEIANVLLLIALYLLQGVPVGLALGSVPFLLKSRLSYSDIGIFTLASYPYSLKLLWSPVVDSLYLSTLGRRKSWIVPIQLLLGFLFYYLGSDVDKLMGEDVNVIYLTLMFGSLVLLSATQDIAVDGWALTLLSEKNISYASTTQTIGLNTGYFLSFTVFLAFNSAEFCNKYLRSVPSEKGILSLGQYMQFWAFIYIAITVWLVLFKKEEAVGKHSLESPVSIGEVYKIMWRIVRLPHMAKFIFILLVAKIGFIAHESVTGLKLLEKGLQKEDLALTVLFDFPLQIIFGYYAAKWSSGSQPLKPWTISFYFRLLFAAMGMLFVHMFPSNGVSWSYFMLVIAMSVLNSFSSTVQFVSMSAFMSTIADPSIGGTYMTLLNTLSNLGGTWPHFFVLEAVDYFTDAKCIVTRNHVNGTANIVNEALCVTEQSKKLCQEHGGQCVVSRDGYYVVNSACVVLGLLVFAMFVRRGIDFVQKTPVRMWRLGRNGTLPQKAM